MTNADYIRSLSSDRLAEIIDGDKCSPCNFCSSKDFTEDCIGNCKNKILQWLQQPRKVE